MSGQKPLYTYKVAAISAAIWENNIDMKGKTVPIQKVTVQRRYKNKAGEWQNYSSFSRTDLPVVLHCLGKIYEKMLTESAANDTEEAAM